MTKVANLSGWDLQDRYESEFIQEIVEELSRKLIHRFSTVAKDLVGINSNVDDISSYIGNGLDDVRIVGICGMGGIGKTTIARVVYEKMSCQFESSSFLANVREVHQKHGPVPLQKQLLCEILMERNIVVWNAYGGANEIRNRVCRRRVLIVLDDVDRLDQLKSLAGAREWFGSGSRIIVTTRNENLLIGHGVDRIFRIHGLNHDEALRLFCLKAFRNEYPEKDYVELCNLVVDYAYGLPLALDVLGSFLFGRSVSEWKSAMDRLKEIPNEEIVDKLRISYDGLEEVDKKIFLDIACFFKGKKKQYVIEVLECCGFYPDTGIRALIDRSLITISENRVWMHDLVQEMGQAIVRRNSLLEPGKRSRLWLYEDVFHVFMKNSGTEEIEGIVLDLGTQEKGCLSPKAFLKMKRLRLLKLKNFPVSHGLEYLSDELQYLEWHGYPFKFLPPTFHPDKLVVLNLRHSHLKQLWKGIYILKRLKFIDVRRSQKLVKTPDFRGLPNLECLNLEGCTRLSEIHHSIGVLERLILLNLKDCRGLVSLPSSICNLKSLKILILSGCVNLVNLPENLGNITSLEELHLGKTGITQLPSSTEFLSKSLEVLSFRGYIEAQHKSCTFFSTFRSLPRQKPNPIALFLPFLSAFNRLRNLDLSDCNLMEGAIPNNLCCFVALEILNLSGNDFTRLPESMHTLPKLEVLIVDRCKKLVSLPELPPGISVVSMHDCSSLVTLPDSLEVYNSSKNFRLFFSNCPNLMEFQGNNGVDFLSWLRSRFHLLLKKLPQGFFEYLICLPRNGSLAGWFNHQAVGVGSSIRIQLPPHWCNVNWKGFAVFALFAVSEHAINDCNEDDDSKFPKLECFLHPDIEKDHGPPLSLTLTGEECRLDQYSLVYIPECYYPGGVDWWNRCSHIEVTFTSRGLEVKKCGVRLLYDQDVEELNPGKNLDDRTFENYAICQ